MHRTLRSVKRAFSDIQDVPPDYENPSDVNQDNMYAITIASTDGNLSASLDVMVTVTDINEAASITGPTGPAYEENGIAAVAEYSAEGLETEDPIAWKVEGADASYFAINEEGVLLFKVPPDYENPSDANQDNIFEITIGASDDNLSAEVEVTVTVTNVNEAPTVTGLAAVAYSENSPSSVAAYTAMDPESDDPITWSVDGVDASHFAISVEGVLSFKVPPDYENPSDANQDNVYVITIAATDGNLSTSVDVMVTVTDINEAASITGPTSPAYEENGITAVAEYSAEGLETEDPIAWTVGGTDALHLAVNEVGVLSFKVPPDYENPSDANQDNTYEITIAVSAGNISVPVTVKVMVTNVNEAPTIAGPTAVDYAENSTAIVAKYTSADPESDDPIAWTVDGPDAPGFTIGSSGVLSLKTPPNFELPSDANQDNTYEIEIIVSDGHLSASLDVSVAVINANDAPSFPVERLAAFIPENSCPGAYAILRGIPGNEGARIDEDGDPLTFALSGTDAAAFVIHPPTGYVTLGPGVALDHEAAKSTYVMRVSVADGRDADGNAETIPVPDDFLELAASVADVDEPPVFVESKLRRDRCGRPDGYVPVQLRREVTRRSPVSAPVGDPIVAVDPEGAAVSYSIETGIVPAPFLIDPVSGQIKVSRGFDFSSRRRIYTVRLTASDGSQETAIEIRISIVPAPTLRPTPTPDPVDPESASSEVETPTPAPNPEDTGQIPSEVETPLSEPTPDDPDPIPSEAETPWSPPRTSDPQEVEDAIDSGALLSEPIYSPPQFVPQKFVLVAGAVPVQSLARAAVESDVGNVSLSRPRLLWRLRTR